MNNRMLLSISGAAALTLAAVLAGGCGVDDSEEEAATGGAGTTGGTGTTGGSDSTGGTDAGGGAVATGGTDSTGGTEGYCDVPPEVPSERITDFSELTEGTSWTTGSQDWGDSVSLTGGTFHYQGEGIDPLTATIVDGALNLTGTITDGSYAGFGFWFGPSCSDASAYSGITFTIEGDMGDTELDFQVQTSDNYPIDDANEKGECAYTNEDDKWSECTNNHVVVEYSEPTTVQIPWEDLVGGKPVATLDPTDLLGVQLQLNCADVCNPDITIDNLMFY